MVMMIKHAMRGMQHKYILMLKPQEDGGKKLHWGMRISKKRERTLPLETVGEKKKVIPRNGWNT